MQMEKDVAISKVVCLVKKVTQSKDIVMELRVWLQDAQCELRSTRLSDRHHCCKLSKIVNNTKQLTAKDKEHVLSLNEKNNEIRVSESELPSGSESLSLNIE